MFVLSYCSGAFVKKLGAFDSQLGVGSLLVIYLANESDTPRWRRQRPMSLHLKVHPLSRLVYAQMILSSGVRVEIVALTLDLLNQSTCPLACWQFSINTHPRLVEVLTARAPLSHHFNPMRPGSKQTHIRHCNLQSNQLKINPILKNSS